MTKREGTITKEESHQERKLIYRMRKATQNQKEPPHQMRLRHKENSQNKTYNHQTKLREIQRETTTENTRYKMKGIPPHRDRTPPRFDCNAYERQISKSGGGTTSAGHQRLTSYSQLCHALEIQSLSLAT